MLLLWPSASLSGFLMNPVCPSGTSACHLHKCGDAGPKKGQSALNASKFLLPWRNFKGYIQTPTKTSVFIFWCAGAVPADRGVCTQHFLFERASADTWPPGPTTADPPPPSWGKNSKQRRQLWDRQTKTWRLCGSHQRMSYTTSAACSSLTFWLMIQSIQR